MENGVVNITNAMSSDFSTVIYCTKAKGLLAKKVINKSSVYYKECKESLLIITWKLLKYCLFNRPDVIHTHGWGTLISGFIVSKILWIKLIHGEHGTVYFENKKNVLIQKMMLSRTDKNLFVSESLAKLFRLKLNLTHNIRVIHNGVDSDRFKKRDVNINEYFPGFDGKIIIGTVGRLMSVKNHKWLIEAISEVLGNKVKLVIVGSGELNDQLKELISIKKLESDVLLYGGSSTPEILMSAFDIFVLPSISEGLSNTVLEAMSCGLPIVASNVGGNSELVSDKINGNLFELNNRTEFIENINKLIESKELRNAYGKASKKIVDDKFSLQVMTDNYQDVYKDVV